MSAPTPLISLHGLCAELRNGQRFEDFNWQIAAGEHWAILGANGSGKTALLRLLLGQISPSAGILRYRPADKRSDGFDPECDIAQVSLDLAQQLIESDIRHDISDVCENAVDEGTTIRALLQQTGASAAEIDAVMTQFGIAELAERGLRFVSTGQLRRSLLARALISGTTLIALDSPLEGLDRQSRSDISGLIEQLMTASHTTLYFSRSAAEIPANATHVLVLRDCRIEFAGSRGAWLQTHAVTHKKAGHIAVKPIDTAAEPLIRFNDVHIAYQQQTIFSAATFAVYPHQHTLVSGPNGCGKSTLLALISADNHKAYGQDIWLFGVRRGSGESIWDIKRNLGVVSTALHSNYPRGFTGLQVTLSGLFDSLGLYDNFGVAQRQQALQALDMLQLGELRDRQFHHLSYGQQRLLLLARAMVKAPRLLILDEPCIGLDDEHCEQLQQQLGIITAQTDTTLLYVSHVGEEIPQGMQQLLEFTRDAERSEGYCINVAHLRGTS
jgi:molybdate transport system ATP-binding protein